MNVNKGWIKLYRELKSKSIWQMSSAQQKVVLITVLLLANHEENKWEWAGKQFECKPGQLITSLSALSIECGQDVTIQNVRTALVRFEKLGFLTNQSTKSGRLITIVNWDKYQSDNSVANKVSNKDLTKSQQRPNKRLTTNKNDKECKNERNRECAYVSPTLDDIKGFCSESNLNDFNYQKFFDYYEGYGWIDKNGNRIKNWKAKLRYWASKDQEKEKVSETKRDYDTKTIFYEEGYGHYRLNEQGKRIIC